MTTSLAGAIGSAVLIVGGLVGLALLIGPRTDEGGPLRHEPELGLFRGLGVALCGLAIVAGALLFGATS